MALSNVFDSGFQKRNRSHFASIVKVAMSDGVISDNERLFLDRLARNLGISESSYTDILKNYNKQPINPPVSLEKRYDRLFDLIRMVYIDDISGEDETVLLHKLCIGLGFDEENVDAIITRATLEIQNKETDRDSFIESLMKSKLA